jgi:hypothetical protein
VLIDLLDGAGGDQITRRFEDPPPVDAEFVADIERAHAVGMTADHRQHPRVEVGGRRRRGGGSRRRLHRGEQCRAMFAQRPAQRLRERLPHLAAAAQRRAECRAHLPNRVRRQHRPPAAGGLRRAARSCRCR